MTLPSEKLLRLMQENEKEEENDYFVQTSVTPIAKNNRNLSTLHDQEIQKIKDEITERKKKELRDRMSKKFSIKYFNNYRRESRK